MPSYTRDQLLEVRLLLRAVATARDLGVAPSSANKGGSTGNTNSSSSTAAGSSNQGSNNKPHSQAQTVKVVKKKLKVGGSGGKGGANAASGGAASASAAVRAAPTADPMSAAGYYSTKMVPPTAGAKQQQKQQQQQGGQTTLAAGVGSLNVWDQRKLVAQEKVSTSKAQAAGPSSTSTSKQAKKGGGDTKGVSSSKGASSSPSANASAPSNGTATGSTADEKAIGSSTTLSLAEESLVDGSTSSFSAGDRAKLAQLREHLKNRTLASQLRPIATEFRPSAAAASAADSAAKKHWSRDWTKGLNNQDQSSTDSNGHNTSQDATSASAVVSTSEKEQQVATNGSSWAHRARTVSPVKSKAADDAQQGDEPTMVHASMTVVGSNEDSTTTLTTVSATKPRQQARAGSQTGPISGRRVPPPRTVGQLRQRNEEDLPVDFRDLIPTTDITGKAKPMQWQEQRDRMRSVAKILLHKNKIAVRAAAERQEKEAAAGGLIDQLNARATTGAQKPLAKIRLPSFREHQATRAKSAIVRPLPIPKTNRTSSKKANRGKSIDAKKVEENNKKKNSKQDKEVLASLLVSTLPVQRAKEGPMTTLATDDKGWTQYLPDIKEFPEDYAALFADWSYADMITESKLNKVTEDVKLLEDFLPEHLEVLTDPESGVAEEYSMMWVEGIYQKVPVSVVTPELIRKSGEAQKVYAGVDSQNLTLKRAFIQHKKALPAIRKERREQRAAEVAVLRKRIEHSLETGLDACDRKAAEAVPLASVLRDGKFTGLTLRHKCAICRARRVYFLKTDRLAMVEQVAKAHKDLQVLDVIAVLHSMMADRVEQKRKKQDDVVDEVRFARMLAKRDGQMNRLALEQEAEKKAAAASGAAPPVVVVDKKQTKAAAAAAAAPSALLEQQEVAAEKKPASSKKNGPPVQVQPLEDSEEELRKRVTARKKHLQIAMRTPGYQIWLQLKDSKESKHRVKLAVSTPIPEQLCSKRAWDGLVRQWRQRLHQYDQFAPEVLGRAVFAKEDIDAHRAAKAALLMAATPSPSKPEPEVAETVAKLIV